MRSCISILHRSSSPPNVSRLIVSVIVDAIYGVLRRWWLPDVGIKRGKAFYPFKMNSDAPSPIVFKLCAFGIHAPLFHVTPSMVEIGARHLMKRVASATAARLGGFIPQLPCSHPGFSSARAKAKPMDQRDFAFTNFCAFPLVRDG